jgi:hypothetical protein
LAVFGATVELQDRRSIWQAPLQYYAKKSRRYAILP